MNKLGDTIDRIAKQIPGGELLACTGMTMFMTAVADLIEAQASMIEAQAAEIERLRNELAAALAGREDDER